MDHKVRPKATHNQVQRASREGGKQQGVALGKGDGDPPAESKARDSGGKMVHYKMKYLQVLGCILAPLPWRCGRGRIKR